MALGQGGYGGEHTSNGSAARGQDGANGEHQEALGGRLEMGNPPGGGTRVLGVVPVVPRAGAASRPAAEVAPSVR